MKQIIILLFSVIVSWICETVSAQVVTEDDGFKWEKIGDYPSGEGAKDLNGNIIIPIVDGQRIVYSKATHGSSVSIGYFRMERWEGAKLLHSLSDVKGRIRIKPSEESVGLSVKICGEDTLAYLYSVSQRMDEWTAFTLEGKRLLKTKKHLN